MENIVQMNDFIKEKSFKISVFNFLKKLHIPFESFRSDNESIIVLKANSYLLLFLTFIPKNIETSLPSIEERLQDIKDSPRFSKGEWVVENVRVYDSHEKAVHFINHLKSETITDQFILTLKSTFQSEPVEHA